MMFRIVFYSIMALLIVLGANSITTTYFPYAKIVIDGNIHNSMIVSTINIILAFMEVIARFSALCGISLLFEMIIDELKKMEERDNEKED